ncbi:MAG TPA: sensor histidine kinase, partial [Pseudomonadales bacterium]|nr:sensor histidine kinase [Pseudomonadales bacterium]
LAVVVDNTERKQAEQVLLNSIHEKETLLKEIHHRVKNNMQVINSLLNLQASHSANEVVKEELTESQMRIKTMALIHQLLYEHQDFSRIHVQEYIERLVKLISAGYSSRRSHIKLQFDMVAKPLYLDLNRAIPCGLIVNELVTNTFKHAFREGQEGCLNVRLEKSPDLPAVLTIQDNGIGLPPDFDLTNTHSLGLQLVSLLTDQLDGEIHIVGMDGTRSELRFRVHEVES